MEKATKPKWKLNISSISCIPEQFRPPENADDRSEWWNGLSKKEKRVAVAYDVLYQLGVKQYKAERGTYLAYKWGSDFKYNFSNLVERMLDIEAAKAPKCRVCAIGSGVLSSLTLSNNRGFSRYDPDSLIEGAEFGTDNPASEVFSYGEWRQLEEFFERKSKFFSGKAQAIEMACTNDPKQHDGISSSGELALRAIFTSVIEHGGEIDQIH